MLQFEKSNSTFGLRWPPQRLQHQSYRTQLYNRSLEFIQIQGVGVRTICPGYPFSAAAWVRRRLGQADDIYNVNVSPRGQWSEPMYPSKWNVSYILGYNASLTRK